MNQHTKFPADALSETRRFTADEFMAMGEAGIFGPDERVELLAGEILVMSPAGRFHEVLRTELALIWGQDCLRRGFKVVEEMQLRLTDDHQPVVDVGVFPAKLVAPDARGTDMLLVVEIADTSLTLDTTVKAAAYAAGGVREYWVVDARTRSTLIHREPDGANGGTYAVTFEVPADQVATPLLVPELAVRMGEFPGA